MHSLVPLIVILGAAFSLKLVLTPAQLTDRVPVVIVGTVVTRSTGPFATHPNLKEQLTPGEKAMVDGGLSYIEWGVAVTATEKGEPYSRVRVLRGVNGPPRGEFGVMIAGTEFTDLAVGTCYRLWLEPGEAYLTVPHYILVEAAQETTCSK